MAAPTDHPDLFAGQPACASDSAVAINQRCRLDTRDGYRVVFVAGIVVAHYAVGDRMAEAHVMVMLVDQGYARQTQVARAFECSERTVRRNQRRFDEAGLAALGRRLGVNEKAVRDLARRLGWAPPCVAEPMELALVGAPDGYRVMSRVLRQRTASTRTNRLGERTSRRAGKCA